MALNYFCLYLSTCWSHLVLYLCIPSHIWIPKFVSIALTSLIIFILIYPASYLTSPLRYLVELQCQKQTTILPLPPPFPKSVSPVAFPPSHKFKLYPSSCSNLLVFITLELLLHLSGTAKKSYWFLHWNASRTGAVCTASSSITLLEPT